MVHSIWEYLAEKNVQAALALFGAASSAHSLVGGLRASRQMEALAKRLEDLDVKIDRLSAQCYAAPNSVVIEQTTPSDMAKGEKVVHNPKEVAAELDRLAKAVGGDVLTSAVIWTPDKFQSALMKSPSDVLLQIRGVHESIVVPGDGNLIPVLFESPHGHCVGWQKRGVLEQVYGLRIDELQWKSVVPVASPSEPPASASWAREHSEGGLVTSCPACGTMFRVVPDQLSIAAGWVRCGQCAEVFDGVAALAR